MVFCLKKVVTLLTTYLYTATVNADVPKLLVAPWGPMWLLKLVDFTWGEEGPLGLPVCPKRVQPSSSGPAVHGACWQLAWLLVVMPYH
eukprot:NODE_1248_length_1216_cov_93.781491_g1020_i0.p2 GENE.NODE_1248_length_1216_cov_93.781491_g1020_i0~~NODE_1248_length_1216_cov_93.781491_g1020_i0.p2  ORF type:complete len:88 (+),score=14.37 NODE_1248_length_1216_cov_93.781491_g1020_i0:393-656(+)